MTTQGGSAAKAAFVGAGAHGTARPQRHKPQRQHQRRAPPAAAMSSLYSRRGTRRQRKGQQACHRANNHRRHRQYTSPSHCPLPSLAQLTKRRERSSASKRGAQTRRVQQRLQRRQVGVALNEIGDCGRTHGDGAHDRNNTSQQPHLSKTGTATCRHAFGLKLVDCRNGMI